MKYLLLEYLVAHNKINDFKEWLKKEAIDEEDEIDACVEKIIYPESEICDDPFG